MRILYAEDEPDRQEKVMRALAGSGHEVVPVDNGRELLKTIQEDTAFDLIVTDHHMPYVLGATAIKRVRENPRLGHVRVIFFAGSTDNIRAHVEKIPGAVFVPKESQGKDNLGNLLRLVRVL